jgi:hypothetical protein
MAMLRQLFLFVRQRTSYLVDEREIDRTELAEVYSCLGKTQCAVWPTAHFISVMVILTVILPEANWAYVISPSLVKRFEPTARA